MAYPCSDYLPKTNSNPLPSVYLVHSVGTVGSYGCYIQLVSPILPLPHHIHIANKKPPLISHTHC